MTAVMRTAGRTATPVSILFAVLGLVVLPASAASIGRTASPVHSIGSGSYQAVMALRDTSTFTAAPLVVDIPANSTVGAYVKPVDIGVFAPTGAYYKMTRLSGAAVVVLQSCTGTWTATFSSANAACSTGAGGIATVNTGGATETTVLAPTKTLTTGKHFRLQVSTKDNAAITKVQLDIELRRPQIRLGTTISS